MNKCDESSYFGTKVRYVKDTIKRPAEEQVQEKKQPKSKIEK